MQMPHDLGKVKPYPSPIHQVHLTTSILQKSKHYEYKTNKTTNKTNKQINKVGIGRREIDRCKQAPTRLLQKIKIKNKTNKQNNKQNKQTNKQSGDWQEERD